MSTPEAVKTQALWCESVTSHGAAERTAPTPAPNPNSTKSDGNAQHKSVPTDVNNEK